MKRIWWFIFILSSFMLVLVLLVGCSNDPNATPVPGSCLVLEERYCQLGKVVSNPSGYETVLKLPAGAPIFSPITGEITLQEYELYTLVFVFEGETRNLFTFAYAGEIENVGKTSIEKGEILARAGKTIKGFDTNLSFSFLSKDGIQSATLPTTISA